MLVISGAKSNGEEVWALPERLDKGLLTIDLRKERR
jgi:hypothetical protein